MVYRGVTNTPARIKVTVKFFTSKVSVNRPNFRLKKAKSRKNAEILNVSPRLCHLDDKL